MYKLKRIEETRWFRGTLEILESVWVGGNFVPNLTHLILLSLDVLSNTKIFENFIIFILHFTLFLFNCIFYVDYFR